MYIVLVAMVPFLCGIALFFNWQSAGEPSVNVTLPSVPIKAPGGIAVPKPVSRTSQTLAGKMAALSRETPEQKAMLAAAVLLIGVSALILLWLILDLITRGRRSWEGRKDGPVGRRAPS